jgi:PAS domain S-box-containing protein
MVEFSKSSASELDFSISDTASVKRHVTSKIPLPSKVCNSSLEKDSIVAILENIPSAVVLLEKPDGKITYANKRAVELHGLNPCGLKLDRHAAKLRISSLDGKTCPTEELYTYRALFHEETIRNKPAIIENTDGKRFIVYASATPLYDKEGNVNAAIIIYDDVTELFKTEEELKESEARLKMAQTIAHVGNWEFYVKEDKAIWSEELFRIFGLETQPYGPSTSVYALKIHPEDRDLVDKKMQQLLFNSNTQSQISFDYRVIRQDGSVRTIHTERMVKEVDQENKPVRIVGIEQDITERKQIEQKLEEYAKNLEKLVAERTKQLKEAERFAAIGQTAGMIGHDIRNPLQSIESNLYLIKQDINSSPEGERKLALEESLQSIHEQVDYINKIICDLQDYARPLKPELVDLDLCAVVPQLISTVTFPANIKAKTVCHQELARVKLDLTFLKRILVNLVTNAVQAMPNGGKLTIQAFEKKGKIYLTVKDTGVGIAESIKPKIFQPLMTTKSKGQGFGLAVVKRLVEAQGGKISFESKVGKGTKFRIEFPAKTA